VLSFSVPFAARFSSCSNLPVAVSGARVNRARMTTKLTEQKLELNSALLKVVEKDGAIVRLSEQLQSQCRTLTLSSSFLRTCHNSLPCSSFRDQNRAAAVTDGSGAGRNRPELRLGCPTRVGGSSLEEH
jgi:hypothetical protein